jgi:hypothetical protein
MAPLVAIATVIASVSVDATANWGLARIFKRELNGPTYWANKVGDVATGTGVTIYVADTGVYKDHTDFTGRISVIGNFFTNPTNPASDVSDCNFEWDGHGTHSASYAAGTNHGVATKASISVLSAAPPYSPGVTCNTTDRAMVAALNWLVDHNYPRGVVNISTPNSGPAAVSAMKRLADANFVVVLSANSGGNVYARFTQALAERVLVVGGTNSTDHGTAIDYGKGLALFAPARATTSAGWITGADDEHTADIATSECRHGCDSYAAPHVSGVAALYLQQHPTATATSVRSTLLNASTWGILPDVPLRRPPDDFTTPNRLLFAKLPDALRQSGGDFFGDAKTDLAIFRAGSWLTKYLVEKPKRCETGTPGAVTWGAAGDTIVPGDYDGDGKTDLAYVRNGIWNIKKSSNGQSQQVSWGLAGDIPVPGDFDGDGRADFVMFRLSEGQWYFHYSSGVPDSVVVFGQSGDIPVSGDFNADGRADLGLFRPGASAHWYVKLSVPSVASPPGPAYRTWFTHELGDPPAATGYYDYSFGTAGDIPVPGDYDGDGVTDLAVFRPSTGVWHVSKSSSKFTANLTAQWGTSTDVPVSGDFDGDAKTDFAIFRPGDGTWWITFSSGKDMCGNNATTATHYWGVSGDIPIPRAY